MTGGGSFAPLPLTAVFAGLTGVFSLGHEYRYGTIRAALTAVPRRLPMLAAKVLVSSAWAVVLAVLTAALGWLVAVLTASDEMSGYDLGDGKIAQVLVGYVFLTIMWSLVGLSFAGLFRSLPASIVLLLLIPLVIESILAAILFLVPALDDIAWLTKYLPFTAGQQMVATDKPLAGPELFDPLPGGVTFGTFTVILLASCTVSFVRRDA
jgi:ABC-type transport system involved in multi-copper enzyme maturation permease subunit